MHSEMGPVRQNSIQRTVRTAHLSVLMTVQCCLSEERGWLSDNGVAHINEITLSRSRLVQVRDIYIGRWPATQVNSAWPSLRG